MPRLPFYLGRIGKTNIGWAVITVFGLYSFVFAKNQVDKQRYENLKAKERMLNSNTGTYEVTSTRRFVKAD
ncbi:hypothetical protein Ocin01_02816 [Orchesella cincta]|uniref:Uncharacterized protein n=1 Tax=Orchesella cincta TaxID=48709 RepID=A0A1D2NF46_ORCCI|nr:hypothetical protein Ocin01_02816 [Orchesella cincta]